MMRVRLLALTLSVALSASLSAQTSAREREHAVRSARAVYTEIEAALRQRRLTRRDTTTTCPPNGLEAHGSTYADRQRRIRRVDTEGGTDDHAEGVAVYFNTLGRARFAFVRHGAANGTLQEERVSYDERGRVVRRLIRNVRGPGYPFDSLGAVPRLETWLRDLCG
jgi:hypothetical protein